MYTIINPVVPVIPEKAAVLMQAVAEKVNAGRVEAEVLRGRGLWRARLEALNFVGPLILAHHSDLEVASRIKGIIPGLDGYTDHEVVQATIFAIVRDTQRVGPEAKLDNPRSGSVMATTIFDITAEHMRLRNKLDGDYAKYFADVDAAKQRVKERAIQVRSGGLESELV